MTEIVPAPGLSRLPRRVRTHPETLAMLRADLAQPGNDQSLRSLSSHAASEPAIALLDAFAVVSDIVAFYSERLADEGYLRTATERGSVRELTRMLGAELRPGVSAQASLVFTVDDAASGPGQSTIPSGTPVQSVPGPGELPQTFETTDEFVAHASWNRIPAVTSERQVITAAATKIWFEARLPELRPGDLLLVTDLGSGPVEVVKLLLRIVRIEIDPEGATGWTSVSIETLGANPEPFDKAAVYRFEERDEIFGARAPLPEDEIAETHMQAHKNALTFTMKSPIEVDGQHPRILSNSWIILEGRATAPSGKTTQDSIAALRVRASSINGASRYGVVNKITQLAVAYEDYREAQRLVEWSRRGTVVHAVSVKLPADRKPVLTVEPGHSLSLDGVDPAPAVGQRIVVVGDDTKGQRHIDDVAIVAVNRTDDGAMEIEINRDLKSSRDDETTTYRPWTLGVHANVVTATHGETVRQVLGSGDGSTRFLTLPPRRTPLTWVRAATASGATPALEVRVDDIEWTRVDAFSEAGPYDRVYRLVMSEPAAGEEHASAEILFGDGVHGAIPSSGVENITAVYRVGTGESGLLPARRLQLMTQRPYGMASVDNLLPTLDGAPADDLERARWSAPLHVRTLDRVVSASDHADFARGYAGVADARADLVWREGSPLVVVTVAGERGGQVSDELLVDLRVAVNGVRHANVPWLLLAADQQRFGVTVAVNHDPAFRRARVEEAIRVAISRDFGPAARRLAEPVTAAAVMVTVRGVPGVRYCTMPSLRRFGKSEEAAGGIEARVPVSTPATSTVLEAAPSRGSNSIDPTKPPTVVPAQLLAVASRSITIGFLS